MYLLGNLNPTQTVGGIKLSQEKEISSIPSGRGTCPRNLCTLWHVYISTAFCPTLKIFWRVSLYSQYILEVSGGHCFRWDDQGVYTRRPLYT
jgi:hypothetical protein